MQYHHFTILFVIIFTVFALKMQLVVSHYEQAMDSYARTERSFYAAADAAGEALCRYGASTILTDKEAAYHNFLYFLYAALGIMDNPAKREELLNYIPMFAVLDEEGFYIYFADEYEGEDGFRYTTRNWTECMPYSYSDEDFVYRFTLDGVVTLYDKNGLIDGTVCLYQTSFEELEEESRYETLRILRSDSFLFDKESFGIIKQTAVITSVQDAMRYYINNYNRIAQRYGTTYAFSLPVLDNSVWARSIEHPGVLVMIQGYPIDVARHVVYNQYAFVGAQIYKKEPYYLTECGWHPTYHRRHCNVVSLVGEETLQNPVYSVEECVKRGAYACTECVPNGVYPPETIYPVWSRE